MGFEIMGSEAKSFTSKPSAVEKPATVSAGGF
jgi:hypothetical protein